MSKSKWQEYKEKNGVTIIDALNPNAEHVDSNVSDARYNICIGCENFIKLTTQCKKCGCLMKLKTKLDGAHCPIGKW
jgi:hypothetical protein